MKINVAVKGAVGFEGVQQKSHVSVKNTMFSSLKMDISHMWQNLGKLNGKNVNMARLLGMLVKNVN